MTITPQLNNIIICFVTVISLWILFLQKVRKSNFWHATVTPLASIIGSGFLVSAPLLVLIGGKYAVWLMICIVIIAFGLGSSIRTNILYTESLKNDDPNAKWIIPLRGISRPILGMAYIISVTFYLKLLSAFLLQGIGYKIPLYENIVTTLILILIGAVGKFRGLTMLESFEVTCVNIKLSIIMALIVGYASYNLNQILGHDIQIITAPHETLWRGFCKLLGIVIIIQGFETSRYLGNAYSPAMRVLSMKYAQIISGIIYVVFIALAMVVIGDVKKVQETLIITISYKVASWLLLFLVFAAIMSQFSAAVADTIGSGGLLVEASKKKISINNAYLLIALITCALTWLTNIFEIITIASKAFALYYFLQIMISIIALKHFKDIPHRIAKFLVYIALFILMGLAVLFGISADY